MEDGLNQVNGDVEEYFESLARDMEEITCVEDLNKSRLREINRREPLVLQVFVLNPSGTLFYPNETDLLNNNEQDFLTQTRKMFDGQDLLTAVNLTLNAPGKQLSNERMLHAGCHPSARDDAPPAGDVARELLLTWRAAARRGASSTSMTPSR